MSALSVAHGTLRTEKGRIDVKKVIAEEGSVPAEELEKRTGIPASVIEAALQNDQDTWTERRDGQKVFCSHMH